ncbi:MAG: gfo/Idh/MocA family oxidoreductase [Luteitalea sp.]|nr:gfo/Idh/MocA family oxidoreductase [Luteitalea sp.]
MNRSRSSSRREFLRRATSSAVAVAAAPSIGLSTRAHRLQPSAPLSKPRAANDRIRVATIGMGIIGFIDTDTALQVPGVELVAAADVYSGRRNRVNEIYGNDVLTSVDYREVLARSDIDAVIIAAPDHWHLQMAIDAMRAGKAVYLEKPMVQKLDQGPQLIRAQKETGVVLQVGSQFSSPILYEKVRELIASGAIGQLNTIEARYNRNSPLGAWQYSIPPDASRETCDWDRFLGAAPERPFDPVRFFRWRNYKDYGTGIPGDLYVHLFTGIHKSIGSNGPSEVISTGGLHFWDDGRDVPDVIHSLCRYEASDNHPAFTLTMQSNFADGSGGGQTFRFVGNEGMIEVRNDSLTLVRSPMTPPSEEELIEGYNSVRTWSEPVRKQFTEEYQAKHKTPIAPEGRETVEFQVPENYDDRFDHFTYFFDSVRNGTPVYQDAVFGFRAAAPSLLANKAHEDGVICKWDPEGMREVA